MPHPTILFVPGAWMSPISFSLVGEILKDSGYPVRYVTLPSVGASPPHLNFDEDVAKIRSQIQSLAEKGQEIVVVCHSYGGIPATEAVQGLDLSARRQKGLEGGVSHLFFCCAMMLPEGFSLLSSIGGKTGPWQTISEDGLITTCNSPADILFNDLPEDQVEMLSATLKPHSFRTFHSEVTVASWKYVPTTYLYCLKDEAIPFAFQKMMVEQFAQGVNIKTETLDASHSPFWSQPKEVAAMIRRAAGERV